MSLAEILKKNAMFVGEAGERKRRRRRSAKPRLLVIGCCCADVTRKLEPALDLDTGEACVIRTAGAWGGRSGDELLRSAVLALHQTGCKEILVVGHDGCAYAPASRARVRESMKKKGVLEGFSERREGMLETIRGPSSPEAGVLEVVRMLRGSDAVPDDCAVHGCMLDTDTFAIRVIDQDRAAGEPPVEAVAQSSGIGVVPLPELPDIPLPEIPELDLDALMAQTETQPRGAPISEYGKDTGTGPVSFSEMQKMPQSMALESDSHLTSAPAPISTGIGFEMPNIKFAVPQGVKIQDTGLDIPQILPDEIPDLEALGSLEAKKRVKAKARVQRRASVTAQESVRAKKTIRKDQKKPARSRVERPKKTPTQQAPPQRPLGEHLISFDEPKKDKRSVRVDLHRGFVGVRGADLPLAPDLQRALLKVQQFLASQFSAQDRRRIIERVRLGSRSGTPFGELLKMMIAPVLKLGKKRYAVINDLLKIKEDLPRQDPEVSVALLMEILGG
jgi:carbonic anhydrase